LRFYGLTKYKKWVKIVGNDVRTLHLQKVFLVSAPNAATDGSGFVAGNGAAVQ
jgi:hypothetical protein